MTIKHFLTITSITLGFISFTSCSKDSSTDDIYFNDDQSNNSENNNGGNSTYNYTKLETETIDVINNYRVSIGLNKLSTIDLISSQAEVQTDYMIKEEKISHDNFIERSDYLLEKLPAKHISENVASGFSSAQSVVDAWLNSRTHKAIIEDSRYTHTGISIKKDNNGKNYFVQLFAEK